MAGDVSDDLLLVEEALGMLASAFNWVFYTPGNHEVRAPIFRIQIYVFSYEIITFQNPAYT